MSIQAYLSVYEQQGRNGLSSSIMNPKLLLMTQGWAGNGVLSLLAEITATKNFLSNFFVVKRSLVLLLLFDLFALFPLGSLRVGG